MHETPIRTDNWVAFDEGWATAFQPLAADHSAFPVVKGDKTSPTNAQVARLVRRYTAELQFSWRRIGLAGPATLSLPFWFSNVTFGFRQNLVPANRFIYQPEVPEGLLRSNRDLYTAFLYESTAPGLSAGQPAAAATSGGELKNAAQMLASEGVIASFFYHFLSDATIQATYEESSFYEQFLRPGARIDWQKVKPQEIFSPLENAFLKVFHVLATSVRMDADPLSTAPLLVFVEGYAREFPAERATLYRVFLSVTRGITVDNDARREDFRKEDRTADTFLQGVEERLLAGKSRIDANVGPQLWLYNRSFTTGLTLFDQFRAIPVPYLFDLNAASIVDLRTIPGVDLKLARTILKQRNERGYFRSIEELSTVPGVNSKLLDSLREMNSAMNEVILGRKDHPLKKIEKLSGFPFLAIFFPYLKAALLKVLVLVAGGWAVFKLVGRLVARLWNVQIQVAPARNVPTPRESNWGRRVRRALGWLLKGIGLLALLLIAILTVVLVPPLSPTARIMVALVLAPICWLGLAVRRREAAPLSSFGSPASLGLLICLAAAWAFVWILV